MVLVGVKLETLVSETDALTTRPLDVLNVNVSNSSECKLTIFRLERKQEQVLKYFAHKICLKRGNHFL